MIRLLRDLCETLLIIVLGLALGYVLGWWLR